MGEGPGVRGTMTAPVSPVTQGRGLHLSVTSPQLLVSDGCFSLNNDIYIRERSPWPLTPNLREFLV